MSITNPINPPISYKIDSGTLTQADWGFLFQIFAEEDILVVLDDVIQNLNSEYTVAINGEAGGTVTFVPAVVDTFTVGKIITLFRNLAAVRTTSYESTQRFDPVDVDGDMDYLTSLSGQVNGNFNQLAARFPVNYPYLNQRGYNILPVNWPNGYALVNQNGTLTTAAIQSNPGDPSLRGELASQIAPNEGSRLVGHTGETVYTRLNTNTTDIGTNTTDIGTNTTDIGTNTTDIGTNATDIGTNATDITTNANDIIALQALPQIAATVTTLDNAGLFTPARSFNVATIVKGAVGIYKITFTTPLPHIEYQTVATPISSAVSVRTNVIATTHIDLAFLNAAGAGIDTKFSMVVTTIGT